MRRVVELTERVAYWTEPHPNWRQGLDWPEEVGCVLYDGPDSLVLVDPLVRDDLDRNAWDWLDAAVGASPGPVAVLLTAPWHERSARAVVARYGAEVWAAPRARRRIDDLPHLGKAPAGIRVFAPRGVDEGQVAFSIEDEKTLVVTEFFLGTAGGLRVCPSPATHDLGGFVQSLHDLARRPIERVLVAHGPPVLAGGREAISAALRSCERGAC